MGFSFSGWSTCYRLKAGSVRNLSACDYVPSFLLWRYSNHYRKMSQMMPCRNKRNVVDCDRMAERTIACYFMIESLENAIHLRSLHIKLKLFPQPGSAAFSVAS